MLGTSEEASLKGDKESEGGALSNSSSFICHLFKWSPFTVSRRDSFQNWSGVLVFYSYGKIKKGIYWSSRWQTSLLVFRPHGSSLRSQMSLSQTCSSSPPSVWLKTRRNSVSCLISGKGFPSLWQHKKHKVLFRQPLKQQINHNFVSSTVIFLPKLVKFNQKDVMNIQNFWAFL